MPKEKEHQARERALRVLKLIVESPFFYTVSRLAKKFQIAESQIKRDLKSIREAGFEVTYDERYRYGCVADKPLEHLKSILVFSEREETQLTEALLELEKKGRAVEKLRNKLSRIYDVAKLHNTFDKHFLNKMDLLERAKKEKLVVILKDYPSTNSNTVSDRTVEPFDISAEEDILHTFDLERKAIRHFKISRISKIEFTEIAWAFETHHNIVKTDPFRIQDNQQVSVHLRLGVGARNELIERFPLTRGYLQPVAEDNANHYFDLICKCNHRFYGLKNFILGAFQDLTIYEPESLIAAIREDAENLLKKNF